MFYLIETQEQLDIFEYKGIKEAFVEVIPYNDNVHPALNKVSLLYIKPLNDTKGYMLCVRHSESLSLNITPINALLQSIDKIYVRDKKSFLYYFQIKKVIDLSFISNIKEIPNSTNDFFY